ncbi:MAG: FAD-binding oxidoreductase [Alphaproteobacteria bacterium]|nr:FAD-binding oxidoreductase [Alphaproteobacteria bacterium]
MSPAPYPESYYAATAGELPVCERLAGEVTADVCVVGGGYTGLSAALNLAERGYSVVVLEAERLGFGASGRNGGQIVTGFSADIERVAARHGAAAARQLWTLGAEAVAALKARIERHAIPCDLKWGYVHVAHTAHQLAGLRSTQAAWERTYGHPATRLLGREEVSALIGSRRYLGGLYDGAAGHLHPLRLALGLARAAQAAGARLVEDARVTAVTHGAAPCAITATGQVRSRYLVLAGNAYLGRLVPELRRRLMPVTSNIVATAPLDRRAGVLTQDVAVADARFIVTYYRLSADGRLLFGGRASYANLEPADVMAYMRRRMLRVFPQLTDTPLDYVWGGLIGITMDRMPHLGRLAPNVFFAQGYSGQGVALAPFAGELIAAVIAGTAERFDVLTRLPHAAFPGGPLRTPALALGMLYYRLRDLL